jgi:hypothetical protein
MEYDPVVGVDGFSVNADIGAARLLTSGYGEFMNVGSEIPYTVEVRRGRVGDQGNIGIADALPRRPAGVQLQPGGSQFQMIRRRSSAEAIHSMSDPLEATEPREPGEFGGCDVKGFGLLPGDQAPLIFGDGCQAVERESVLHCSSLSYIFAVDRLNGTAFI